MSFSSNKEFAESVDVRGHDGMESLRITRDDIKDCGNIPRCRPCLLEIAQSRREDISLHSSAGRDVWIFCVQNVVLLLCVFL